MSPLKQVRNFAASAHQRLLNKAREDGTDFNLVLQRYAVERFLYRLGISSEVDLFTLKGAALFLIWAGKELRPTRDVDFLGALPDDHDSILKSIEAVCAMPCPEDGVDFDPASIRIDDIRDDQEYGGVRVRIQGTLGNARLALQVDIGFGDVITPEREEQDYPTILDHPAPRIWAYPRETTVAEKFEAMVRLGRPNSRVKDLWDITTLARHFAFDGETLANAIEETLTRRGTSIGDERPESLRPEFYKDATRARRWEEFRRQVEMDGNPAPELVEVGEHVREFLGPVCDSLTSRELFTLVWRAGGPWRPTVDRDEGGDDHV